MPGLLMLIRTLEAAVAGRPINFRVAARLTDGITRSAPTATTAAATAAAAAATFCATCFLSRCGPLATIAACGRRVA
jgi:cytochrome c553